jgi:hypothetical protein
MEIRKMKRALSLASALLAFASMTPASAAPLAAAQAGLAMQPDRAGSSYPDVIEVGWRHGRHRPHRHGRPYHRYGWGPAIGSLAAGAIVGNALASNHAQASADAYCEQKYKSYDPASGTYLGHDGERHPCP